MIGTRTAASVQRAARSGSCVGRGPFGSRSAAFGPHPAAAATRIARLALRMGASLLHSAHHDHAVPEAEPVEADVYRAGAELLVDAVVAGLDQPRLQIHRELARLVQLVPRARHQRGAVVD